MSQLDLFTVPVIIRRTPEPPPIMAGDSALADRFETMADKMQSTIDAKLSHDRQTNTPKRMAQAMSARVDGERLTRTQQALRRLAELHRAGQVPRELIGLRSKKAVHDLTGAALEPVANGFHTYYIDTGKPKENASAAALAIWAMLEGKSDQEKHADKLAQMVRDLQFSKIPGYFPTPDAVIDLMLEYAQVQDYHSVLEPSAGSGAITDRLPDECLTVVYEINPTLCEILRAKGFDARPVDFLDAGGTFAFDRVLMNPPFENLADIDHVLAGFERLKSGGRLVSAMSPSPFFRDTKKAQQFRAWLESVGGEVIELPEGSFKESGTGVSSRLVIIDRE